MCARYDYILSKRSASSNSLQDQRRMSTFMQYAMAASSEALDDAGWHPNTDQEQEMTVTHTSANVNEHDSAELEVRAYVWAPVSEV